MMISSDVQVYLEKQFKEIRELITAHADTDLAAYEKTQNAIREQADALKELRQTIGSIPPKTDANGTREPFSRQLKKTTGMASEANLAAEALASRMISVENELKKQSRQMGIGAVGLEFLKSKEGQALIWRAATFIAVTISGILAATHK